MNRILVISIVMFLLQSCCVWTDCINEIPKEQIPNYQINYVYIFKSEDQCCIDTFTVDTIISTFEEENEEILIALNNRKYDEKSFFIAVQINGTVILYDDQIIVFNYEDESMDVNINDKLYENVYKWTSSYPGDSDTIISELLYQIDSGILCYTYENGDKFLLDSIIQD